MAKILTNQELLALNGQPLINQDAGGGAFTLRAAIVNALMAHHPDEGGLSGEEKLRRFEIALRVQRENVVELSSEDISLIKSLVGKAYSPAVVGPVFLILEGREDVLPPRVVVAKPATPTDSQPH